MKKNLCILTVVLTFLCGLMFTSCEEEVIEELAGPTNTWCWTTVSYSKEENNATQSIDVYMYYTDTEVKVGKETIEPGITMLVTPTSTTADSTVVAALKGQVYAIKTFKKEAEELDGDFKIEGTREKWSGIYWMRADFHTNQSKSAPECLQKSLLGDVTEKFDLVDWDTIKEDLSWKRLLANYLLNSM